MKKINLLLFSFLLVGLSFAQQVEKENIHEFETLRKKSNLRGVSYDPSSGNTTLTYLENNMFQMYFRDYVFDKELKFVEERENKYTFGEKIAWESDAQAKELRSRYPWFNYRGETYTQNFIDVWRTFDGKLQVRKASITYTYNWPLGMYLPKIDFGTTVKLGGENDEKIYPYERVINSQTGDLYLLVGVKPPKSEKKGNAYQHCRKFQIVRITPDMKVEYLEEIQFDYNMGINYTQVITPNNEPNNIIGEMYDISQGQWMIMLSPISTVIARKFMNKDNPGAHKTLLIDSNGKITSRLDISAPSSGWVIEGAIAANGGKDVYIYGPAKDKAYVNKLQPTNSPLTMRDEIKDIRYKNFQIMKITDGKQAYLASTELGEFKDKAVTPPSQKKTPEYIGKNFEKSLLYITPDGQFLIAGQKYTTKMVDDPADTDPTDGQDKIKVKDKYKDLVMFHFDAKGVLKSAYGIRRDFNNKHAKANPTPQGLYLNKDGSKVYWVYDEIKGNRPGFSFGASMLGGLANTNVVLSKAKLLTFPAVAVVDLGKGSMSDFIYLGTNDDGKNEFYTFPAVPPQISADGNYLSFVGEDRQGKRIWLARMVLE